MQILQAVSRGSGLRPRSQQLQPPKTAIADRNWGGCCRRADASKLSMEVILVD